MATPSNVQKRSEIIRNVRASQLSKTNPPIPVLVQIQGMSRAARLRGCSRMFRNEQPGRKLFPTHVVGQNEPTAEWAICGSHGRRRARQRARRGGRGGA